MTPRKSLLSVFLVFFIFVLIQFVFGSKSRALEGIRGTGDVGDRGGGPAFLMQVHMGAKGIVKERMQLMKSYAASMKAINVELRDMASVNYILINEEANKIVESSQTIMGLFPPGSGEGVSEASPRI